MKRTLICLALIAATTMVNAAPWTYRGTLNDGGKPANGAYDLRLTLVNEAGTTSISQPITLNNVAVKDGNFAADVDFGFDLSNAPAMKLETEVQQNGSGFTSLGEPNAFDAKAALAGICWDTTGNVVAAGEFLGSTNNVPVELKANNSLIGLLTPRFRTGPFGNAPSVALGAPVNEAAALGATVGGGGSTLDVDGFPPSLPNRATGEFSTVSGGRQNTASGEASTASGGASNTATGPFSTISGGRGHAATGQYSTVSGGIQNSASGQYSTVSGGQANCAGGDFSIAFGRIAKVRLGNEVGDGSCAASSGDADGDNGTFVWADDQATEFTSTGPRQFLVRAQGGMAINTNTPTVGAALTVAGDVSIRNPGRVNFGSTTRQMLNLFEESPTNYGMGVQTATMYSRVSAVGGFAWFQGGSHNDAQNNPGTGGTVRMTLDAAGQLRTTTGTIATTSDARLKKNVTDYTGALAQIGALRPVYYEYKDTGKSFQAPGQHLGFIAQEVQQVFPQWVSTDDEGYLMLSLRGFEAVAVRAMQELSVENKLLKTENATQNTEIAALNARLAALEAQFSK